MSGMSSVNRVKLMGAIVVLAGFCLLCAGGLGISIHGISETGDSLAHWRVRAEEPGAGNASPMDRPAVRVRDLEKQLASHKERAVVRGGMFLFFGVLTTLGFIKWLTGSFSSTH